MKKGFAVIYIGLAAIALFLVLASLSPKIGKNLGFLSQKKQTQESHAAASTQSVTLSPKSISIYDPNKLPLSWTNPLNASATDNQYATASGANHLGTKYLQATDFGFNIPTNTTIKGIVVAIERKASQTNTGHDSSARLVKGVPVTIIGDEKCPSACSQSSSIPTTDSYKNFGSLSDTWSAALAPADVNSSGFGVLYSAWMGGPTNTTVSVDHIKITIYYALPNLTSSPPPPSTPVSSPPEPSTPVATSTPTPFLSPSPPPLPSTPSTLLIF